ncbi:MAG TPA: DUF6544 family protein [Polyangiaceae bacterium]|nr:DUF6544 family protein [Polyangiaceae bacterium]
MWIVLWAAVTLVGLTGTLVSVNAARFAGRVRRDARELFAAAAARPPELARLAELPAPVRRYLGRALGSSPRAIGTLRFRHGGRFRTSLDGPWQPIRGEQYDTLDPPGFLWWGRLRVAPGVWVDAVDRGVRGKGRMSVALASTLTLFERSGSELDQGAMLRLLSDFVLLPGLMLDARYVTWQPLDEQRALCTLHAPGTRVAVTGTFEFDHDGLPRSFRSERYMDSGKGTPRLLPWSGDYADYRPVGGLLVPHHFIGYWHVDGQRVPYVDFVLEPPEYDVPEPY